MTKKVLNYFDKLEDKTRAKLSRVPIAYALLGGIGIVLFWRGIWHTADFIVALLQGTAIVNFGVLLDGPLSFIIGTVILLITGVFVSSFIGNRLIISGLSGEKKLTELTKEEIITEEDDIRQIEHTLKRVEKKIEMIEEEIQKK